MNKSLIIALFFVMCFSVSYAGGKLYTDDDLDNYQSAPKTAEDIKMEREREAALRNYLHERERNEQLEKDRAEAELKAAAAEEEEKSREEGIRRREDFERFRQESSERNDRFRENLERRRFENELLNSINNLAPAKRKR